MYDLLLMDIRQSCHNLLQVVLCLQLADALSFLQHLIQRVVAAQLQHHVDILRILEDVVEGDDVAVL